MMARVINVIKQTIRTLENIFASLVIRAHVFLGCYMPRTVDDFIFGRLFTTPRLRSEKLLAGKTPSLYKGLTQEEIFRLEYGVRLTHLGVGFVAWCLSEIAFARHERPLAVALEYTAELSSRGLLELAETEMKRVIKTLETSPTASSSAELHLFHILLAHSEVLSKGLLKESLTATRIFREWIEPVPLEEYSDVMVSKLCA